MPQLLKNAPWSSTITVAELIEKLQQYPPEMAVAFTWEGQIKPVFPENFTVSDESRHIYGPVLLMDAET